MGQTFGSGDMAVKNRVFCFGLGCSWSFELKSGLALALAAAERKVNTPAQAHLSLQSK